MNRLIWAPFLFLYGSLYTAENNEAALLIAAGRCYQQKALQCCTEKKPTSSFRFTQRTSSKRSPRTLFDTSANNEIAQTLYFNALACYKQTCLQEPQSPLYTILAMQQADTIIKKLNESKIPLDHHEHYIIAPWRELLSFWEKKEPQTDMRPALRDIYDVACTAKEAHHLPLTTHGKQYHHTECINSIRALCYLHEQTDDTLNKQRIQLHIGPLISLCETWNNEHPLSEEEKTCIEQAGSLQRKYIDSHAFITQAQKLIITGQQEFPTQIVQRAAPLKAEYVQLFTDMLCDLSLLQLHEHKCAINRFHIQSAAQQLITCIEEHNLASDNTTDNDWPIIKEHWQEQTQGPIEQLDQFKATISAILPQQLPKKKSERKRSEKQIAETSALILDPLWIIFSQANEDHAQYAASSSSTISQCDPEKRYLQTYASLQAERIKRALWPKEKDEQLYNLRANLHASFRPWVRHDHTKFMHENITLIQQIIAHPHTSLDQEKHTLIWASKLLMLCNETMKKKETIKPALSLCTKRLYERYNAKNDFNENELNLLLDLALKTEQRAIQAAIIRQEGQIDLLIDLQEKEKKIDALFKQCDEYKERHEVAPIELFLQAGQLLAHLIKYDAYKEKLHDKTNKKEDTPLKKRLQRVTSQLYSFYAKQPLNNESLHDLLLELSGPSGMHHIPECIEQIDNSPLGPASLERLFKRLKDTEQELTEQMQKKAQ